jgi:hypothetical protein
MKKRKSRRISVDYPNWQYLYQVYHLRPLVVQGTNEHAVDDEHHSSRYQQQTHNQQGLLGSALAGELIEGRSEDSLIHLINLLAGLQKNCTDRWVHISKQCHIS